MLLVQEAGLVCEVWAALGTVDLTVDRDVGPAADLAEDPVVGWTVGRVWS